MHAAYAMRAEPQLRSSTSSLPYGLLVASWRKRYQSDMPYIWNDVLCIE